MNKVKWGIIGPGKIAHRFADGLKECFSGELVSIASKTEEHLNSFGDKYPSTGVFRISNRARYGSEFPILHLVNIFFAI